MSDTEKTMKNTKQPLFRDLKADDPDAEITEIESLCMNCGANGTTRLLLTKIPHYKEVIIMSFDCPHCGYENNEIQSGGKISEKGIKITLQVCTVKDLNREVVKSDSTSIRIPHLDFEIPAQSQKGEITTVEGILDRTITNLKQDQPQRYLESPEIATNIDLFLMKLDSLKIVDQPFTIIFEDVTGNCYVENPKAPLKDNGCRIVYFERSKEQNSLLGITSENEDGLLKPIEEDEYTLEKMEGEVLSFPTNCPSCGGPCETNMKMTNIPHFKDVVIMATSCEHCGHRTNEVKSGGGIEPKGIRIEVTVAGKEDFSRDVLKSETCCLKIPELELEVGPAALNGRFTTVEGLIVATKDQLTSSTVFTGDSSDQETLGRIKSFVENFTKILDGEKQITLILNDPAGNSYVQSLSDDGLDDRLKITKYDRSFEENEELGINDMKIENYENSN